MAATDFNKLVIHLQECRLKLSHFVELIQSITLYLFSIFLQTTTSQGVALITSLVKGIIFSVALV